jgi:hypothetical protein
MSRQAGIAPGLLPDHAGRRTTSAPAWARKQRGLRPRVSELTSARCMNLCRDLGKRPPRSGCRRNVSAGSFLRRVFRRSNLARPGALAAPVLVLQTARHRNNFDVPPGLQAFRQYQDHVSSDWRTSPAMVDHFHGFAAGPDPHQPRMVRDRANRHLPGLISCLPAANGQSAAKPNRSLRTAG